MNPEVTKKWENGEKDGAVSLQAGTWVLKTSAFNTAGTVVAKGETGEFEVIEGKPADIKVALAPDMEAGNGTFRIEAEKVGSVDRGTVTVTRLGASTPAVQSDFYHDPGNPEKMSWSGPLPSGQYNVQLALFYGKDKVVLSQLLHIYSNLESIWRLEDAGLVHSGETLLDAWNGTAWDFERMGIGTWHL